MSISRSWAGSPTEEDGGPTAAVQYRIWWPTAPRTQQPEPGRQLLVATGSCITRSMTTPEWPTQRSSMMSKHTAAGFWARAEAFFADIGVQVSAVMTDNGACYRSAAFKAALGEEIKHQRTRPRRPQTNGKVERFNRTLMSEWAYARSYISESSRAASYGDFLHYYNHHRTHTALGGAVPSARVHNLTGKYN